MRRQLIYCEGQRGWLLAAPLDRQSYWGDALTKAGRYLTLHDPVRDEETALRLANDLDAELVRLCRRWPVPCPTEFQITIRLEDDPSVLRQPSDGITVHDPGSELILPTPSIVGSPVTEADYRPLYGGYLRHVLSHTLTELVGYDCCEPAPIYAALLGWQLAALGSGPPILADDDVLRLQSYPLTSGRMQRLWQVSERAHLPALETTVLRSFIDFALTNSESGLTGVARFPELVEHLCLTPGFWAWVAAVGCTGRPNSRCYLT